ncbi:hypothetical protein COCSADRAFT_284519 [Bipolaris sorokiniana ND90Pr]|uniref:cyclin-dependent kinase n=1 Tax=Cochliobolus sativus (strain ND90Pr / ATCC 201652) TaxID=665912 RepID=M2SIP1_COCSN|nr:uncharacterized protein COCSADRAFT_284519 [Bipolaris sorokiniana ND90Pr]EMD67058.1 hypothetical protein COCSADRAFT_284519 [Bipolaris sorokiniana ND90Pr]
MAALRRAQDIDERRTEASPDRGRERLKDRHRDRSYDPRTSSPAPQAGRHHSRHRAHDHDARSSGKHGRGHSRDKSLGRDRTRRRSRSASKEDRYRGSEREASADRVAHPHRRHHHHHHHHHHRHDTTPSSKHYHSRSPSPRPSSKRVKRPRSRSTVRSRSPTRRADSSGRPSTRAYSPRPHTSDRDRLPRRNTPDRHLPPASHRRQSPSVDTYYRPATQRARKRSVSPDRRSRREFSPRALFPRRTHRRATPPLDHSRERPYKPSSIRGRTRSRSRAPRRVRSRSPPHRRSPTPARKSSPPSSKRARTPSRRSRSPPIPIRRRQSRSPSRGSKSRHPTKHISRRSSPVSGSGYNSDTSKGRRDDDKMRGAYHYQGRGGFQQSPPYPSHNQYSPQNQSPYHSGRGGWSNQPYPNHGSPPHGYTSGQSPYHQSQSPGYYQNQSYPQSGFQPSSHRGGHGGFRGNSFHGSDRRISGPAGGAPFSGPGGRGRGAAPTQFSNLSWTPASGTRGGRPATEAPRPQPVPTSQTVVDSTSVDADDNPFRPSKDLRVEDEGSKEEQKSAPPAKSSAALPTATKSGFGFSLKTKNPVPPASKAKLGLEEPEKAEQASKESLLDPKAKVEAARDVAPPYAESRSDRDRDPRERDYDHSRERDLRERDLRERDIRERDIRERDRRYDNYYDRKPIYRDPRERDPRDIRDSRDPYYRGRERDFRDPRDRDFRDPRDVRDGRDIRERDSRDLRDPRDIRDPRDVRDIRDRREPYFPRRHDDRRPDTRPIARPERRTPPPQIPKTKTITKKREKPRPTLAPEHATSESVYYRKPGNESVVGSGTYGKVFKGVHVYTKDMVALKKIRMEGERDGFPVTAIREVKLLQSLNHPNIVNLREVMVEKNDCYMVFEYLSHDLTGLLNHPTFKLETSHKKDLAKQLFEGLDYLHRRGVLHRDIKAANILVSNTGQLKLADFGLARFYSKSGKLDYTNRVITIWYRSPELLLGETQYGPAVDIWSAACVLVEIFTRHAIFPGDGGEINQLEKIYNVLGTPTVQDWPGIVDMQWFELLRPTERKKSTFAEKYKDRVSPMAFELLQAMFLFDPNARPAAADVLEHPFFTSEAPAPKRAEALKELEGDWHEFESKALRKEKEKQEKEARRAAREEKDNARKDEGKRRADAAVGEERDAKRAKSGDVTA